MNIFKLVKGKKSASVLFRKILEYAFDPTHSMYAFNPKPIGAVLCKRWKAAGEVIHKCHLVPICLECKRAALRALDLG